MYLHKRAALKAAVFSHALHELTHFILLTTHEVRATADKKTGRERGPPWVTEPARMTLLVCAVFLCVTTLLHVSAVCFLGGQLRVCLKFTHIYVHM